MTMSHSSFSKETLDALDTEMDKPNAWYLLREADLDNASGTVTDEWADYIFTDTLEGFQFQPFDAEDRLWEIADGCVPINNYEVSKLYTELLAWRNNEANDHELPVDTDMIDRMRVAIAVCGEQVARVSLAYIQEAAETLQDEADEEAEMKEHAEIGGEG